MIRSFADIAAARIARGETVKNLPRDIQAKGAAQTVAASSRQSAGGLARSAGQPVGGVDWKSARTAQHPRQRSMADMFYLAGGRGL